MEDKSLKDLTEDWLKEKTKGACGEDPLQCLSSSFVDDKKNNTMYIRCVKFKSRCTFKCEEWA
jgi:hypothetical protein